MQLITNHYTFDVKRKKMSDTLYFYTIGNLQNKSYPCMEFMISKEKDGWYLTLEHLQYYNTCSIENLEQKAGTKEMVQGAIIAILKKHPQIDHIHLQDASFFTTAKGNKVPLPEYRMISQGKTWYQEYFGAVPVSKDLRAKLKTYKKNRADAFQDLQNVELSEKTINDIMMKYDLKEISHRTWAIPIETVATWKYEAILKKTKNIAGGIQIEPFEKYVFRFLPHM